MLPDVAATLAGFLLPFSWIAGQAARWFPDLAFSWRDYLEMWEYDDGRPRFWWSFGAGFVLSLLVDAALLVRMVKA